jgi:hypothetical protein
MTTITHNQRPPGDGEPRSVVLLSLSPTPWRLASPTGEEPTPESSSTPAAPASPPPVECDSKDRSPGSAS